MKRLAPYVAVASIFCEPAFAQSQRNYEASPFEVAVDELITFVQAETSGTILEGCNFYIRAGRIVEGARYQAQLLFAHTGCAEDSIDDAFEITYTLKGTEIVVKPAAETLSENIIKPAIVDQIGKMKPFQKACRVFELQTYTHKNGVASSRGHVPISCYSQDTTPPPQR